MIPSLPIAAAASSLYVDFLAELRLRGFEGDISATDGDRTVFAVRLSEVFAYLLIFVASFTGGNVLLALFAKPPLAVLFVYPVLSLLCGATREGPVGAACDDRRRMNCRWTHPGTMMAPQLDAQRKNDHRGRYHDSGA